MDDDWKARSERANERMRLEKQFIGDALVTHAEHEAFGSIESWVMSRLRYDEIENAETRGVTITCKYGGVLELRLHGEPLGTLKVEEVTSTR